MSDPSGTGVGKPSEDSVKLFVGQVPRDWGPDDLRSVMMEAGHVYEVSIVRDRDTKESKGCAFVLYMTREEADGAIKMFHCNRTLQGAKGPMQVKYADGQQVKLENKLFVGMLPKTVTADELRDVFSAYGTVVELNVLRGPAHASKGSAFVKYENYSQALAAINGLNNKHKMDGSNNAIVVKWADSDKEKNLRKAQKQASQAMMAAVAVNGAGGGVLGSHLGASPYAGYMQAPGASLYGQPPMPGSALSPFQGLDMAAAAAAAAAAGMYPGAQGSGPSGMGEFFNPYGFGGGGAGAQPQTPAGFLGGVPGMGPDVLGMQGVPNASASAVAAAIREKLVQREGPPGANLFVYNIPAEWRDQDLLTAFAEFGNVISTKVFMDKITGQSKGFGFVSFQSAEAADAAIAVMDGFVVGGRKLKVSLKRGAASPAAAAGGGAFPDLGQQQHQPPPAMQHF